LLFGRFDCMKYYYYYVQSSRNDSLTVVLHEFEALIVQWTSVDVSELYPNGRCVARSPGTPRHEQLCNQTQLTTPMMLCNNTRMERSPVKGRVLLLLGSGQQRMAQAQEPQRSRERQHAATRVWYVVSFCLLFGAINSFRTSRVTL
jgi:hypothetical protein